MNPTDDRLPSGWVRARLAEVAAINPRNPDALPAADTIVSFVPMAAVHAMSGRIDTHETRPWRAVRKGYTRFQDGDVLFAKITPCMENGKVAVARNLHNGVGAGSTEFHLLRPSAAIHPDFLFYYLLRDDFRTAARVNMTGTAGQLRVPQRFFDAQTLPVPPIPEQHRIVETIRRYFRRIDEVVGALERVRRNLRRYRASVLQAAAAGRLAPTEAELARAEGRGYEPASALLDRILAERRRRWEEAELAKMAAKGKTPKDGWRGKYREPAAPDVSDLPTLPEGWCWARLNAVTDVDLGQQRHPGHAAGPGQVPYLRAANITWAGLDLRDVKTMAFPNPGRFVLQSGDVLLSEASGSPMEAGKPAIWRDEIPGACFQNTVLRVRPLDRNLLTPEFLRAVFLHDCLDGRFARLAPGVGIVHISARRLSAWRIPLPPTVEQHRIVAALTELESHIGGQERSVAGTLNTLASLRQAILVRAFAGKLMADKEQVTQREIAENGDALP